MKVAAYTAGPNDPSAYARVRQYIPLLGDAGIAVREYPLPFGAQLPGSRALFVPWAAATLGYRAATLIAGHASDCTWVCRQFLPTYLNVKAFAKKPIVLDVDDAIWLTRGGNRVEALARAAEVVVCGNTFLAQKFSQWNSNIVIAPTAVAIPNSTSTNVALEDDTSVVIGWSGTSGNFPYLYALEDALRSVMQAFPLARLLVVADSAPHFSSLPADRVEFCKWTRDSDEAAIARMSIGLMPVEDSDWARGKCAYKMLRYMSYGAPVVVSPVGMNLEVLARGEIGFGAGTTAEWVDSLSTLVRDRSLRATFGRNALAVAQRWYSTTVVGERYREVFHSLKIA
jgi:glycosyltransferase involved in cell wall biosynthesis